jgi:hypothetical protein
MKTEDDEGEDASVQPTAAAVHAPPISGPDIPFGWFCRGVSKIQDTAKRDKKIQILSDMMDKYGRNPKNIMQLIRLLTPEVHIIMFPCSICFSFRTGTAFSSFQNDIHLESFVFARSGCCPKKISMFLPNELSPMFPIVTSSFYFILPPCQIPPIFFLQFLLNFNQFFILI